MSVSALRESAAECLKDIISKGMQPIAKAKLIDWLMNVLEHAGVFNIPEVLTYMYLLSSLCTVLLLHYCLSYIANCRSKHMLTCFKCIVEGVYIVI